ncbi:PPE family protein [Mycobacterium kansasii]|uniref:PPE family protein n=1 Tax=Mycobacterium kansasii TaxID=1768 RepID=UPI0004F6341D|nr:PPE family protein [Mycobacterium kansasii]ARG59108.1 PPE family protein [Mycobacterium kansasii]ARG64547.1 PPE family protein [Mycobacterium kansasii]
MTVALDFAMLPPEINSARMYSGPGSGPMLAAASAWKSLAAELRATALSYHSVLAALTGEEWYGPASASMAAAAAPYVAWLNTTAVQAEQTAVQAEAAAGAYEAAFGATVPPPVIAANRAQLMALIATNILGQNTPAIAATEAQYTEMWAQDAMAMYGYAGSSAAATQLSPFVEPQQATNPSGLAAQAAAVTEASANSAGNQSSTLSGLISMVPSALQGLSGPNSTSWLQVIWDLLTGSGPAWWQTLWNVWGPNANVWNTITSTGLFVPGSTFAPFMASVLAGAVAADAAQDASAAAAGVGSGLAAGPLASTGSVGSAVSAGLGNAGIVGKLSVPPAWTAAAPLHSPLGSALGGTPMVAPPPAVAAGMPGMPFGNMAGQPFGRAVPQYGFRPPFVARPPAAG